MHDIDLATEEIFKALEELALMKNEGFVKNIDVSASYIDFLYKVCLRWHTQFSGEIGSLVAVFFANVCIQNVLYLNIVMTFSTCVDSKGY